MTQRPGQESGVDIAGCDAEPIHIPGRIQPHGALLVIAPGLRVIQCSANIGDHCGRDVDAVLGARLGDVFPEIAGEVADALGEPSPSDRNPLALTISGARFDGVIHRVDDVAILELEPCTPTPSDLDDSLRLALRRLETANGMQALFELAVSEIRRMTGFDRVMIYPFDEDGHGEVVAEARDASVDAYLGLRYPASDIPRQARELYRRNWLRVIPDARYAAVPIVPTDRPDTGGPIDLSGAVLRSVSPVHLEYLANMGLRASMSVSLLVRGELWGLISCGHHAGPRPLPFRVRSACELLGRLVSLQIAALREVEGRRVRDSRRGALVTAIDSMQRSDDVFAALGDAPDAVLEVAAAQGAAVVVEGRCTACIGTAPSRADIEELVGALSALDAPALFVTKALAKTYEPARAYADRTSGVLAMSIPRGSASYLLWFRPELVQTVSWGGDPDKAVERGRTHLHPRRSFAEWRETVRGTSRRWTDVDVELAGELRRQLIEIDLARQVLRARAAVRARDQIVAVVSHDLRTPLGVVRMQTELLSRATSPTPEQLRGAVERIRRSTQSMTRLVEDLLDTAKLDAERFAVQPEDYDADALVAEALQLVRPLAEQRSITLEAPGPTGRRVRADADRMYQVLSNVVGNAIKYTPEGGRVRVTLEERGPDVLFSITDTGPGLGDEALGRLFERYWRAPGSGGGGFGLGLYIARGIVEAHGGRIAASSAPGQGLTITFTLPSAGSSLRADGAAVSPAGASGFRAS